MPRILNNYINGQWVGSRSDIFSEVINRADDNWKFI